PCVRSQAERGNEGESLGRSYVRLRSNQRLSSFPRSCVGTQEPTLCVLAKGYRQRIRLAGGGHRDAERPCVRSHAERGNEGESLGQSFVRLRSNQRLCAAVELSLQAGSDAPNGPHGVPYGRHPNRCIVLILHLSSNRLGVFSLWTPG